MSGSGAIPRRRQPQPKPDPPPPPPRNAWLSGTSMSSSSGKGSIRVLRRETPAAVPGPDAKIVTTPSKPMSTMTTLGQRTETMAERLKRATQQQQQQQQQLQQQQQQQRVIVPRVLQRPKNLFDSDLIISPDLAKETKDEAGTDKIEEAVPERRELTEAEREVIREQRRERRRKEKEKKRREREQEKRASLYLPKTSKIKFITPQDLQKASSKQVRTQSESSTVIEAPPKKQEQQPTPSVTKPKAGIRFMDDEYPELGAMGVNNPKTAGDAAKLVRESSVQSDFESASEWETEDEGVASLAEEPEEDSWQTVARHSAKGGGATPKQIRRQTEAKAMVSNPSESAKGGSGSYSSILRSAKEAKDAAKEEKEPPKPAEQPKVAAVTEEESKKVKRSDPIKLDIMSMIKTKADGKKKKGNEKVSAPSVLTGKIAPTKKATLSTGNKLDSSAPSVRRGKEREKPRRKRKSKMKRIILEERRLRRLEREANRLANEQILDGVVAEEEKQDQPDGATAAQVEDSSKAEEVLKAEDVSNPEEVVKPVPEDMEVKSEAVIEPVDGAKAVEEEDQVKAEAKVKEEVKEEEEDPWMVKAKQSIHSRKFRDYCDHVLCPGLDDVVRALLSDLVRFQDKQHAKDPVKARARRRYVVGLREIRKFLTVRKVTLLVLAPDLERSKADGGLDDTVRELRALADRNEVPVVFFGNRYKLGKACLRKVPVSAVGVLNHQGSEDNFRQMMEMLPELKQAYKDRLDRAYQKLRPRDEPDVKEEPQQQPQQPQYRFPIEDPSEEIVKEFLKKIKPLMVTDQPS